MPDPISTTQPKPNEVYATFCGSIDQNAVNRIMASFAGAMMPNLNIKHIHLLFQSTGGFIGDGVCLYNYFKSLPIELTLYNVGSVQSIATIAYLGANKRKTSASATFVIHRSTIGGQPTAAPQLQAFTNTVLIEDARTQAIINAHITLAPEHWETYKYHDLIFTGQEAVSIGIAQEIGEFSPTKGTQIYNI